MKERQHDFLHESFCNSDECSLFPVLSNRDVFEKLPWFCLESSDFESSRACGLCAWQRQAMKINVGEEKTRVPRLKCNVLVTVDHLKHRCVNEFLANLFL